MRAFAVIGALAIACAGAGCGSSNHNPTPVIDSISPASVPAGSGSLTINISGTNINNASTVELNGTLLVVAGVQQPPCGNANPCPVILTVVVPATQTVTAGSFPLNVTTDGKHSKNFSFNVLSPQIVGESPVAVPAGAGDFALTLTVLNATQTVQVQFDAAGVGNTPLTPIGPVTCNTSTACNVVVMVPAASVKTAGTIPVTVVNPHAQSGGTASTNFVVASAASGQFPLAISAAAGTPGNAASTHSSVSDGGAFVAFDSTATNLTGTATTGLSQVYLQTNCFTGGTCSAGTTLISGASGAAGSGGVIGSDKPAISADGRFVVFESDDTNLVAGTAQAVKQIYLFDTCGGVFGAVKGCTPKMTLVSTSGSAPGDGPSTNPAISASGMFIAFQSSATNLTSAVPANTQQIYLFTTCNGVIGPVAGCTPGMQLISTDANGNPGDADSTTPALDPAGLAVAFESQADNILAGVASNGSPQVYLRTTCLEGVPFLAAPCGAQTALVSGDASNRLGTGDSVTPALTDNNGALLAVYATSAGNLLPVGASGPQIVGATVCVTLPGTTPCRASGTRVLSVDQNGVAGNGASSNPSAAGGRVVFTSQASLLSGVSGMQVYGTTMCIPPVACTAPVLISADSTGTAIGGDFGAVGGGGFTAFSTTGSASSPGVAQIFLVAPF